MGRRLILAAVLAAVLAPGATAADRSTLTVHGSSYGAVLFDGRGFVLYAFTADRRGRSVCTGECARRWPPLLVKGSAHAGTGAKASLLGTTRRADGSTQATYA